MKARRLIHVALAALAIGCVSAEAQSAAPSDAALVQRGEYLARAGDCIACHSAAGGKPFAGGLAIATPIGRIYSTNITPDRQTGIGDYTLEDFDRALRHGIARGGYSLYPAMPYTEYARVKPEDVKALYAFFMQRVQPVVQADKPVDIPWPLSMRWPLAGWRRMFAPEVAAADAGAVAGQDQIALGRYLVEGLGHCGSCHTPRGVALQEKALTDDGSLFLSGAPIDGWLAKSLRGDSLGAWSAQDIALFLKNGRNSHSAAFGGMSDVVGHSTQYMSEPDLAAVAAYLKTLTPRAAAAPAYDPRTAEVLHGGDKLPPGALTYLNNCAACHRTDGKGYAQTFPGLALSSTVNTADPLSLIHIVLEGAQMPGTGGAPTRYAMPGFASRLNDSEVAGLLSFVRNSWGNQAAPVSATDVAKVRKSTGAPAGPQR